MFELELEVSNKKSIIVLYRRFVLIRCFHQPARVEIEMINQELTSQEIDNSIYVSKQCPVNEELNRKVKKFSQNIKFTFGSCFSKLLVKKMVVIEQCDYFLDKRGYFFRGKFSELRFGCQIFEIKGEEVENLKQNVDDILKSSYLQKNIVRVLAISVSFDSELSKKGIVNVGIFFDDVEYGNLESFLKVNQKIPYSQKIRILYNIALGIDYFHSNEQVLCYNPYTEIRMRNILIGKDLVVKFPIFQSYFSRKTVFDHEESEKNGKQKDIQSFGVIVYNILSNQSLVFGESNYFSTEVEFPLTSVSKIVFPSINHENIFSELLRGCWNNENSRPSISEVIEKLVEVINLNSNSNEKSKFQEYWPNEINLILKNQLPKKESCKKDSERYFKNLQRICRMMIDLFEKLVKEESFEGDKKSIIYFLEEEINRFMEIQTFLDDFLLRNDGIGVDN